MEKMEQVLDEAGTGNEAFFRGNSKDRFVHGPGHSII